jgi:tetratricopeptide (TPR) repeat protein
MSIRNWLLVAVSLGTQTSSRACLRFFEETPPSAPPSLVEALMQHEGRAVWEERAKARQVVADKTWDYRTQNNLSVALAHIGKLDEALDRMQTVERTYPNQVETAYNLGTVYELKNDLPKSKFWIQEGVKRELKSTGRNRLDGTEWLHIRILDAKLGLKSDPHTLGNHGVSGLDFGTGRTPQKPVTLPRGNAGATLTLAQVQGALQEQLHERLEFVPAPDPVVGDLLFDFGNALALNGNDEDALDIYKLALTYAPSRASLAQSRFNYFAGTPNYALIGTMWGAACGLVAFYFARKRWLERQEWKTVPVRSLEELGPEKRTAFIDYSKYDG